MAAALFVIGGVVSLVVSLVGIPIYSLYPFQMQYLSFVVAVVLIVGLICSLGAIHCYTLVTKRLMSAAGFRGSSHPRFANRGCRSAARVCPGTDDEPPCATHAAC